MMNTTGKMRDRIVVTRRGSTVDGYGNPQTGAATAVGTFWADFLERLGQERLAAGAFDAPRMATVRVRRNSSTLTIRTADTVTCRGADWNIRSIAEVGRNNELLELSLETGVAT